jgi:exodeoxyribonuclease VII small subunit
MTGSRQSPIGSRTASFSRPDCRLPIADCRGTPYFKPMSAEQRDPAALSFEESLAELEKIVAHLERGDVPLADSIRIYKRGAALKARCEGQLKDAQLEVDQIVMDPDGPRTEPAKLGQ